MFEVRSGELFQRALQPPVSYGRHILARTLRQVQDRTGIPGVTVLTQPEVWQIARTQFVDLDPLRVTFLRSLEHAELAGLEQELPETGVVVGLGGGQAMDTAKYIAWKRARPLVLAPTIVSVDAAVTNTIALREHGRVHYVGFCVADAIPVDLSLIARAPRALNRAGVGDLLSIHTALWDWQHAGPGYHPGVAGQARAILAQVDEQAEEIAACSDGALRLLFESYVKENALCLQVGSSRPEEGSEHYLGYNLEYLSGRGYIHGQLICLCTYAMARLQENRPQWVRALLTRTRCPWRLRQLGISASCFIQALLTLRAYAEAEGFAPGVITQRPITPAFAQQLAHECAG
jgi:glycerol-1-phosphate dehydrogenase [NAD(P)+]